MIGVKNIKENFQEGFDRDLDEWSMKMESSMKGGGLIINGMGEEF